VLNSVPTNTPLLSVPHDYSPDGSASWFTIGSGPDAGKRMFYFDCTIGTGPAAATVVFVHGNPECSYTYRHIWRALLDAGTPLRVIAMDHIGFGLSDQATFEMVDMHHAANLAQFVRHLDLNDVTLAVHDWGGPIGIGAFITEPDRVRNLLVMNTTVFPMPSDGFTYENFPRWWLAWCKTPALVPDALWGGVAAYVISHGEPQPTWHFLRGVTASMLTHAFRRFDTGSPEAVWSGQLRSGANTRSSKRNVLQTPYWGHGYCYEDPRHGTQDNRAFYRHMQEEMPRVWGPDGRRIPVTGYFGAWDPCGKDSVIRQWHAALPQMIDRTYSYADVGHFIEEYKGPEIAGSILTMNGLRP
jgi:pimeloyl-ACP methyl ester carboxylesterase